VILSAVFFTLLFLTSNTMGQSFRERIPEFAILKTIGFSDRSVVSMLLAEAVLLCVVAGFVGLSLARLALPTVGRFSGGTVPANLPSTVLVAGFIAALLLALASGLPSAWRARRLAIVDALAEPRGA
jgi:putative ABC transport system permease protein